MQFIKLEKREIRDALSLVWNVFLEFQGSEYSKQGIQEFKKFISYDSIIEGINNKKFSFWGCKVGEDLVGVISTRGINHIAMLFVKKEYHRKGISKKLFEKVKEECKDNHMNEITVNSSPFAIEVYHRLGFKDKDKEQTVNGLRFTPMFYSIN
ncbi:GNAT family N-acetyltransferase [Priestia filamentosa]|uniref:GNAT family N-acetyltransferase n=1 Tax=Priestia filamentosa TaxID=1402861 RepID=UPI0039787970